MNLFTKISGAFTAFEARIASFREEGKTPRPWHGISHFDVSRGEFVLYPIPLNLLTAFWHFARIRIKTAFFFYKSAYQRELRRAWQEGNHAAYKEMQAEEDRRFAIESAKRNIMV